MDFCAILRIALRGTGGARALLFPHRQNGTWRRWSRSPARARHWPRRCPRRYGVRVERGEDAGRGRAPRPAASAAGAVRPVPAHQAVARDRALARRAAVPVAAAAVYLAFALVVFASTWRDPFTRSVGNPGDSALYMWGLAWTPYALTHGLNPFFTDFANFPAGANLLWNTVTPAAAIALWPVTSTLGPVFAYNVMETLALALSAWSAFLLIRRFLPRSGPAFAGGLVYGFSPYMAAQSLGHTAITLVFLPPLILAILDEILRVQRRHPALLGTALGLVCAVEFFISEEMLLTTGIISAIVVAIAAATWPRQARQRVRRSVGPLVLGGLVLAAAAVWPLSFQLLGPQRLPTAPHDVNFYVSDLLGFWVPTDVLWLAPRRLLAVSAQFSGNDAEWNSYIGIPLTLLLVLATIRERRSDLVRVAAPAAAVIAILSMGITVHVAGRAQEAWSFPVFVLALGFLLVPGIPARVLVLVTFAVWLALWRVPLVNAILPSRLMLFAYLMIGFVLAVFLAGLRDRRHVALGVAALVVALVPLLPRQPYFRTINPTPAFFAPGGEVARVPDGSVALVAPVATYDHPDAMRWQAVSRMRFRMPESNLMSPTATPGGILYDTPRTPATTALIDLDHGRPPVQDDRLRQALRDDLAALRVRTVIVGPMADQDRAVALLTEAIGRPPEAVQGVYVWWDVEG
jgi:hypothetical protein